MKSTAASTPNNPATRLNWVEICVLFFMLLIVLGVLQLSGNLHAGAQLVDDNQIFELDARIANHGFFPTLVEHELKRIEKMRRFVPLFLLHKVAAVKVLGTNLVAWSIYTGVLAACSGFLLYIVARLFGFNIVESLVFGALTIGGHQSVTWWRLIQGEGLAMLFLSLALVCMAKSLCPGVPRTVVYTSLFIFFSFLASLCKESFILLFPVLAFWRTGMAYALHGLTVREVVKRNIIPTAILATICLGELLAIRTLLRTTHFSYAGWKGFDLQLLWTATRQFFGWDSVILAVLCGTALLVLVLQKGTTGPQRIVAIRLAAFAPVLAAILIVPQLLLYHSSGFFGHPDYSLERYFLPGQLGVSLLVATALRIIREPFPTLNLRKFDAAARRIALATALLACVLMLMGRAQTIRGSSIAFAKRTSAQNTFLTTLEEHTNPNDVVLIVYLKDSDYFRRRFVNVAKGMIDRHHLFYFPVPRGDLTGHSPDPPLHGNTKRNFDAIPDKQRIRAVVIQNHGMAERNFRKVSKGWFDPSRYERYRGPLRHVVYYKSESATSLPTAGPDALPTRIGGVTTRTNAAGNVVLRGWILSPYVIDEMSIYVDGEAAGPVEYPQWRPDIYQAHPKYRDKYAGFRIVLDDALKIENLGTVRIDAYSGGSLIARETLAK